MQTRQNQQKKKTLRQLLIFKNIYDNYFLKWQLKINYKNVILPLQEKKYIKKKLTCA